MAFITRILRSISRKAICNSQSFDFPFRKVTSPNTLFNKHGEMFPCVRLLWSLSSNNVISYHPKMFTKPLCNYDSRITHRIGCKNIHTKGDQELVQFLAEEIAAETKAQKSPVLPKIEGFSIQTDSAALIFNKKFQNENITVKLNVNHSVDTDVPEAEIDPSQDKPELGEMKSKPSFTVEVERTGSTIGFTCSFVQEFARENAEDPDAFNDIFNIEEIVFHQGNWKENTYSVSGDIIDGYLYDLLMNFLEERGISTEFAEKLSDFCTSYEHKLYINLLENLKAFVSGGK